MNLKLLKLLSKNARLKEGILYSGNSIMKKDYMTSVMIVVIWKHILNFYYKKILSVWTGI